MGLDSLSLIDFETLSQRTVSRMNWMPLGKRGLPASSLAGVTRAVGKNYEFTFRVEEGQRQLYGHMYDFGVQKDPLLFDIVLQEPRQDSMVIVTPFHKKPRQFYYNRKISGLPAEGRVIYQDRNTSSPPPPPLAPWTGDGACGPTTAAGTGAAPPASSGDASLA